jgi:hypothetical protein
MRKSILVAALCALVALLLPAVAAAKTVELHHESGSFNGADAVGAGAFSEGSLEKVAVDKATGAVIVATGSDIYRFNATGASQPFSALAPKTVIEGGITGGVLAIDNSGGPTQGRILNSSPPGETFAHEASGGPVEGRFPIGNPPGLFGTCGAAVDVEGNIWLRGGEGGSLMYQYNTNGEPTGKTVVLGEEHEGFCQIELDAQGNFYAAEAGAGFEAKEFSPEGTLIRTLNEVGGAGYQYINTIAVDRSTGDYYLDVGEEVEHFNAAGEFVESLGPLERSTGVAVNSNTHTVYAIDNGPDVSGEAPKTSIKVFTSTGNAAVATATTEAATAVTRTGVTLNGKVDPEGVATTRCHFELRYFDPNTNQLSPVREVPCAQGNVFTGTADQAVSASPTGLLPERKYQYRLIVDNGNGPAYGITRGFETPRAVKGTETEAPTDITRNSATFNGSFDPDGLETHYYFEYGEYPYQKVPATPVSAGSGTGTVHVSAPVTGLSPGTSAAGKQYEVRLVAENETGKTVGEVLTFHTLPAVLEVKTLAATALTKSTGTLNGSFEPGGLDTHYYFEWGLNTGYGKFAPVPPPGVDGGGGTGVATVNANLTKLELGKIYHFRLVATNAQYGTTYGEDETFVPGEGPTISVDRATEINTDTAALEATINPNSRETTYHWEYGLENCAVSACTQTAPTTIPAGTAGVPVRTVIENLTPGATYHFRLVAENALGPAVGEDHFFITFRPESGADTCPNVLVRKQTGAAATAHCRAYELVSAANTDGYDVESNLIAGSNPLPGFPDAGNRVLYTLRFGGLSGLGDPPNRGGDPYLATRGPEGWTTSYVGLSATGTPSTRPFSSTLAEADGSLDTFAFGGPETCEPCFPDGSRNMPLRLPDGELVKGMAGDENPPAEPAGEIAKRFSADGHSFVFGSTSRFEPAGNQGSLSIYERNLASGTTQVVSTEPDGSTMGGAGIAELDVSADGSHVLIGRQVGTDAAGNPLYDLYMHVGSDPHSVAVATPTGGALYAGMTADGSTVYFTTTSQLADDTDSGADLFRAVITPTGATVTRVSTGVGGSGDTDACTPAPGAAGSHWNAPGASSAANCGVVAIGGGGGVASTAGTVYFLSPELLSATGGVAGQPNLYAAVPGSSPAFVATLSTEDPIVKDAVAAAGKRETADFQVTPDGRLAVFDSFQAQGGVTTAGHEEIYRSVLGGGLSCVSCIPTNGSPTHDTRLTADGLNLTDDGRVLFTSNEQLVLRDTNQLQDAYEWDEGRISLISTGLDTNDSGLLTASADGTDAFFFTRQNLAPQDQTGGAMKIYDAREGGGFLYNPPAAPCVASDECHGPGTQPAPSPPINTIEGTGKKQPTEVKAKCAKGKVKKGKKCVKRPKKKHPKKHAKKHSKGTGGKHAKKGKGKKKAGGDGGGRKHG